MRKKYIFFFKKDAVWPPTLWLLHSSNPNNQPWAQCTVKDVKGGMKSKVIWPRMKAEAELNYTKSSIRLRPLMGKCCLIKSPNRDETEMRQNLMKLFLIILIYNKNHWTVIHVSFSWFFFEFTYLIQSVKAFSETCTLGNLCARIFMLHLGTDCRPYINPTCTHLFYTQT